MRYDFSLDVGQSIKSEEQLKEEQKQAEENERLTGEELSAKRMEEELKNKPEQAESAHGKDSEDNQDLPEKDADDAQESSEGMPEKNHKPDSEVKVKEISFEKAELLKEHAAAQKAAEDSDNIDEDADSADDDGEEVANEVLEDSFSKETENYANNARPKLQKQQRSFVMPVVLLVILLAAAFAGFIYMSMPEKDTASALKTSAEELSLEPILDLNETPAANADEALQAAKDKEANEQPAEIQDEKGNLAETSGESDDEALHEPSVPKDDAKADSLSPEDALNKLAEKLKD